MLVNSNKFNFQFFLSNIKKVADLTKGAEENGGATQYDDGVYSNIEGSEHITINDNNNSISLFIPSTIEINKSTDNTEYVKMVIKSITNKYNNIEDIKFYNTKGSWYSDNTNSVVIEDITIITTVLNTLTIEDINYFIEIANYLKFEMSQDAISLNINGSLCLI